MLEIFYRRTTSLGFKKKLGKISKPLKHDKILLSIRLTNTNYADKFTFKKLYCYFIYYKNQVSLSIDHHGVFGENIFLFGENLDFVKTVFFLVKSLFLVKTLPFVCFKPMYALTSFTLWPLLRFNLLYISTFLLVYYSICLLFSFSTLLLFNFLPLLLLFFSSVLLFYFSTFFTFLLFFCSTFLLFYLSTFWSL